MQLLATQHLELVVNPELVKVGNGKTDVCDEHSGVPRHLTVRAFLENARQQNGLTADS